MTEYLRISTCWTSTYTYTPERRDISVRCVRSYTVHEKVLDLIWKVISSSLDVRSALNLSAATRLSCEWNYLQRGCQFFDKPQLNSIYRWGSNDTKKDASQLRMTLPLAKVKANLAIWKNALWLIKWPTHVLIWSFCGLYFHIRLIIKTTCIRKFHKQSTQEASRSQSERIYMWLVW